jgi:hypothetical protein
MHNRILAMLWCCAFMAACSATDQPTAFETSGGSTAASTTTTTSTGTGDGTGVGGGFGVGGSGGTGSNTTGCSSDLQRVVDGSGNVIEQCPPEQGCAAGKCVPACQAAAMSQGNVGCDFLVATPLFNKNTAPPCFAAFVANDWPKATVIHVTRGNQSYDVTQFARIAGGAPDASKWAPLPASGLPPGQVAVLFLSQDPTASNGPADPLTCPVKTAVDQNGGTAVSGTGVGEAWHVTTDVPVSAYDILPYGGAASFLPSAELLLPTSAWGTNFVAVLPKDSTATPQTGNVGPPWGQIVATSAGTKVQVVPTVALPAGSGVAATSAKQLATYTLDAGQYLQWELGADMTGSVIQSDKPIAFTGGNGYICYRSQTSAGGGCDAAHQMIPPVAALGSDYVAPPFRTRIPSGTPESIPYRLVGAVDGTTLAYDPPVPGAPASLSAGQRIDFESAIAFRVTSQDKDHPFYVGQIMPGCAVSGFTPAHCDGDEEFVNVLPPAQFLSKYVFFTDPTYPTTNLVVVRVATPSGFKDVNLDCAGKLSGFKPVGTSGLFEITDVDLVRDGAPNGSCANGPHVAESDGPFGIMVWGLSHAASYAYPAGGSIAPINTVVVPPTPK